MRKYRTATRIKRVYELLSDCRRIRKRHERAIAGHEWTVAASLTMGLQSKNKILLQHLCHLEDEAFEKATGRLRKHRRIPT